MLGKAAGKYASQSEKLSSELAEFQIEKQSSLEDRMLLFCCVLLLAPFPTSFVTTSERPF
eukprot:441939-Amphidinium_carterae.1